MLKKVKKCLGDEAKHLLEHRCLTIPKDNLYLPDGSPATNPKLVEKIVTIAGEVGRELASPDEARQILSLDSEYRDRFLLD